jgi:hypothetical protein
MSTRKADRKDRKDRKRETRKQSGGKRAPTEWTRLVTATYKELKARNPDAKLKDAMREASRRRKSEKK